jgi:RNA 2',3'-cyclic 3'-phosphodiesterase
MNVGEQRVRLFVSLSVPAEVRSKLAIVQDELRAQLPLRAASWTRLENIHLTLRFLGDVDPARVEALTSALATVAANFNSLPLVAERVGCFPDLRYPRIFWAWVHDADGQERLAGLHRCIVDATAGFADESAEGRFVGHLTLARFKQIKRPQADSIAAFAHGAVDRRFGEWTASSITLMRSELSPGGSRYTCRAELPLRCESR